MRGKYGIISYSPKTGATYAIERTPMTGFDAYIMAANLENRELMILDDHGDTIYYLAAGAGKPEIDDTRFAY